MNQRHRGVPARRPGRRMAAIRMPAVRRDARWSDRVSGSMIDGECRNADCPHAPGNSSSIQAEPADAVPYIGSSRTSDWSLHGVRFVARHRVDRHHDGFAQQPADQHGRRPHRPDPARCRVASVSPRWSAVTASAHDNGNVMIWSGSRSTTRPPELSIGGDQAVPPAERRWWRHVRRPPAKRAGGPRRAGSGLRAVRASCSAAAVAERGGVVAQRARRAPPSPFVTVASHLVAIGGYAAHRQRFPEVLEARQLLDDRREPRRDR